ncbi:MAG: hypothetical protein NC320_00035 [Clostridium sp.]|nr:hypothetical protein [Clostridium sp.]MCM1546730.1 hypothetical protein [Ruminococcus sp.]
MIRAVMRGYDENDMHNLFQVQRNKLRSSIIFVICFAAVIIMLIIALTHDYSRIFLKIPICAAAVIGFEAVSGHSKDDLNEYPEVLRTGTILFSFSNSDFRVAASNMENIGTDDTDYKMQFQILENGKGMLTYEYSKISKVIEDKINFYIFLPNITYIVRKDSVIDGTPEELSVILHTYLQNDYKYAGK